MDAKYKLPIIQQEALAERQKLQKLRKLGAKLTSAEPSIHAMEAKLTKQVAKLEAVKIELSVRFTIYKDLVRGGPWYIKSITELKEDIKEKGKMHLTHERKNTELQEKAKSAEMDLAIVAKNLEFARGDVD